MLSFPFSSCLGVRTKSWTPKGVIKNVNLKTFKTIEMEWADAKKAEKIIEVKIKYEYEEPSRRLSYYNIQYLIDGKQKVVRIKNE